jgi:branched-chain amino acid transport system substrate-binding protein
MIAAFPKALCLSIPLAVFAASAAPAAAGSESILVGNLVDYSGPTASVATPYGRGKQDAAAWINAHGGIGGVPIVLDTVDYAYEVPRALAQYQAWQQQGAVAIQGWGTADTEALLRFITEDKIPYFSGSYSAQFTDPAGKGPQTKRPSPYNFIMGPSYSDGLRALLQWARADWQQHGETRPPVFVHMGDNHPYPNSPKKAGEAYAAEMGFVVKPAIQYPMVPGDVRQQCLDLKSSGADFAYLGNTGASNAALLRTCRQLGVTTRFLANIWGFDENAMRAAGPAGDGVVFVMGAAPWTASNPGMALVHDIARAADPAVTYQPHHYVRGVCAVFFMADAMRRAADQGGVSRQEIRDGMYARSDWAPDGLEGACAKATWSAADHRGFNEVWLYRARISAEPAADAALATLMANGTLAIEQVGDITVARKPEWLGW